jgi:hypothetical protein
MNGTTEGAARQYGRSAPKEARWWPSSRGSPWCPAAAQSSQRPPLGDCGPRQPQLLDRSRGSCFIWRAGSPCSLSAGAVTLRWPQPLQFLGVGAFAWRRKPTDARGGAGPRKRIHECPTRCQSALARGAVAVGRERADQCLGGHKRGASGTPLPSAAAVSRTSSISRPRASAISLSVWPSARPRSRSRMSFSDHRSVLWDLLGMLSQPSTFRRLFLRRP